MWWSSIREFLSTLVLLATVASLIFIIWGIWTQFRAKQPSDRSKHRCSICFKDFKCRIHKAERIQADGSVSRSPLLSAGGVRTTERECKSGSTPTGAIRHQPNKILVRRPAPPKPKSAKNKNPMPAARRSAAINGFQRKTVHIGSMPIEVAETSGGDRCCSIQNKFYCSFPCYRTIVA